MADIAYVPTIAELLYLALVLYAWSGKIVGWAMADRLRAELVLDAIARAVGQLSTAERTQATAAE